MAAAAERGLIRGGHGQGHSNREHDARYGRKQGEPPAPTAGCIIFWSHTPSCTGMLEPDRFQRLFVSRTIRPYSVFMLSHLAENFNLVELKL
jgi:hypothetical protein